MCFKVLRFNLKCKETVLHAYKAKRTNENPPSIHIKESKIKCNAYVACARVHIPCSMYICTVAKSSLSHVLPSLRLRINSLSCVISCIYACMYVGRRYVVT